MKAHRVLFVDDEASLRLTFPPILELHGFEVRAVATVAEALLEITTRSFEVLISDLNIGQPGDGFTVVSAMRRTQPDCINYILTGYPAFESALTAIQSQVDDYFVKPAKIEQVVTSILEKMQGKDLRQPMPLIRLSSLLRDGSDEICDIALSRMKSHPALLSLQISDAERVDHLPIIVREIAHQLDSSEPDRPTELVLRAGREHGVQRLALGYEISMLVTDASILDAVVYDVVRERLLTLDTSNLVIDLKRFNMGLQIQLQQSVQAFWDEGAEMWARVSPE
jgi:ActR/RegA family two-component response regulator